MLQMACYFPVSGRRTPVLLHSFQTVPSMLRQFGLDDNDLIVTGQAFSISAKAAFP
jgi:hypothetical protein